METSKRADLEFGSIPGLVREAAERYGAEAAIEDNGEVISFSDLAERVDGAAAAFMALGVAAGDRVAIWAPNAWEWIVSALGIHSAGGVVVPVNTRFKGAEAAYILERSGAKALVTVTGFLDTDYVALLAAANVHLPALETTIVFRGDAPEGTLAWDAFLAGGAKISQADRRVRREAVSAENLSDIIFTSGTTGHPKGAVATHGQTLRTFGDWCATVGLARGDRYLVVLPFFHTFGYKAGWLSCLLRGATILPEPVFDVDVVLGRVAPDRVSVLPGPPALYQTILARADLDTFDLSTLRLAVTGAAVIPVELIHRMRDELAFDTVITGYGLTEATGVVSMCRTGDDPETIAQTSGRAIPDVEVRIVDEAGAEVPRGEPGEIVVRGYNVTAGYYENEEATAEAIDGDGWLHTGDIGTMDERGYLRITDRLKDMYTVGGFNAYPAEIENTLLAYPGVAQVAVIGVPDTRLGQVGRAYVVPAEGAKPDPEAMVAWSRDRMANYKVPRSVVIVGALPMNATGKVQKFVLREEVAADK